MPSHSLKFKLAKVLIAAAWADGRLANEELNALKDLLFGIPEITPEDWKKLMLYMESPVDSDESHKLLDDLMVEVKGRKDREYIFDTLNQMVASDGEISVEEQEFVNEVHEAMDAKTGGFFKSLKHRMKTAVRRHGKAGTEREQHVDDYTNNEVYHHLVYVQKKASEVRLPEDNLRRMCLSAGFMAWVLHSDLIIDDEDSHAILAALMDDWHIRQHEASIVADAACERIVKGVDFNRLCRTYHESVEPEEAERLVTTLSRIANLATQGRAKKLDGVQAVIRGLKLTETAI